MKKLPNIIHMITGIKALLAAIYIGLDFYNIPLVGTNIKPDFHPGYTHCTGLAKNIRHNGATTEKCLVTLDRFLGSCATKTLIHFFITSY